MGSLRNPVSKLLVGKEEKIIREEESLVEFITEESKRSWQKPPTYEQQRVCEASYFSFSYHLFLRKGTIHHFYGRRNGAF